MELVAHLDLTQDAADVDVVLRQLSERGERVVTAAIVSIGGGSPEQRPQERPSAERTTQPIEVTAVGHAQPDHDPVLIEHRHRPAA